jgi:predicted metalloprotease with PDZ domain
MTLKMNSSYISYQVSPVNLSEHLFEVSLHAELPAQRASNVLRLTLPAWIPGSYMIRDFARNIIQIHSDNTGLTINKSDKQSWELCHKDGSKIRTVSIIYRVFAFDLSVRSAFINHEYAFFNGTSALLKLVGFEDLTHYLQIDTASAPDTANWDVVTAMPPASDAPVHFACEPTFISDNYSVLIDHPVLMGNLTKRSFDLAGVRFHVVFTGEQSMDIERICEDLKPICQHHIDLFGECPVQEYWFMTLLCDKGFGGLEHKSSTVLQYSRFDLPMLGESEDKSESYQQFLSLCSHELFHTWHVKRIRPRVLLNPDLSDETYTPQLWIYEGFTSLYDDLTLARSGVISPVEYCQVLGQSFTRLMRNPGRHLQSISESSFDAWTRFYKQDASSVNHIVSYYLKGSIVALALDITLRQQSNNRYSLDDVMRLLWQQFGKDESGTLDDVIGDICEQQLGIDIRSFLHVAVTTTMDLPLSSLVQSIGLQLHMRERESVFDKGGKPAKNTIKRDIGASFSDEPSGMKVTQVLASSSAAKAGLQLNDTIFAVNRYKASTSTFTRYLNACEIDASLALHVMRDNQLLELDFIAQPSPLDTCFFSIEDEARFKHWLGLTENDAV